MSRSAAWTVQPKPTSSVISTSIGSISKMRLGAQKSLGWAR
jgi:hypothetical protein